VAREAGWIKAALLVTTWRERGGRNNGLSRRWRHGEWAFDDWSASRFAVAGDGMKAFLMFAQEQPLASRSTGLIRRANRAHGDGGGRLSISEHL
jgi:hypothetical protein